MDRLTLLPCPFCAGRAEIKVGIHTKYVMCPKCEVMGPNLIDEDELVAAWNRRQSLSQEAVRDEALAEAAKVCDAKAEEYSFRSSWNLVRYVRAWQAQEDAEAIRALKREPNAAKVQNDSDS